MPHFLKVNTASRMESTSEPMRIQMTDATYRALKAKGGFHVDDRGEIEVKGKDKMQTYWLTGAEELA